MNLVFKQLYNGESVKNNNGLVFKILTIGADDNDFTPTPSLVYTLSNDGTYYIIGTGFTDLATLEADTSGGTAGSGLDSTWAGGELYIPNKYNGLPVKAIAPRAFQDIPNKTACYIQEGITHIGHRAFQNNGSTDALVSIELPKSLTYLGGSAGRVLYGCKSLVSINTKNITTIEQFTFNKCTSLKQVYFPNVTSIEYYGVAAKNLEYVYMPKITTLGGYAFDTATNIKQIIIEQTETVCTLSFGALKNSTSNTEFSIYVPDSKVNDYKQATNWSTYGDYIKPLSELPQEYKDLYNIA